MRFSSWSMLKSVLFVCVVLASGKLICQSTWWHGGAKPIKFNSEDWQRSAPIENSRTVRSQMIPDILESYDFSGWSHEKVISLLGEPDAMPSTTGYTDWHVAYTIGLERSNSFSLDMEFLIFRLDAKDKVIEYRVVVN